MLKTNTPKSAVNAIRKMEVDQQWAINRQAAIDCGNRERLSTGTLHSDQRLYYWRKASK